MENFRKALEELKVVEFPYWPIKFTDIKETAVTIINKEATFSLKQAVAGYKKHLPAPNTGIIAEVGY